MRGYIILFGESFRTPGKGQCQRDRGSNESYSEQIKAANSHMNFIKDLNNKACNIDVYIGSYDTQFTTDLINVYKDKLIGYKFYNDVIGQGIIVHNSINAISNIESYNFLLIMRIDLFLKDKFIDIFNINWDKILWPSICFKPYHKCGIHPRVNDMMIFVPKKYYNYLKHLYYDTTGHNQWEHFIKNTELKTDDLDTMINTFHDSDSFKDYNPLYYIVNRKESDIHHTKGDTFNKYCF